MYSSTNSNSRLQFELGQFETQYNNLMNSKTQRECILNSNELMRVIMSDESLSRIFNEIHCNQRGQFNKREINLIKYFFGIHIRTELFAISEEPLKYSAIDIIYKNSLCLNMPVHVKYWSLYKACLFLEQNSSPQNQAFLKQFEHIGSGNSKIYDISQSFRKLILKLIENEKNGIFCKNEEIIKLEKKPLNDMQIAYDKFQRHLEVEKPANDVIYKILHGFQFAEQNCMDLRFGICERLIQNIRAILISISNFKSRKSSDLISKFANVTKDGQIDSFTFLSNNFGREIEGLDSTDKLGIQACIDYVASVYEITNDFESFMKKIPNGYDDLDLLFYTSLRNELIDLIISKNDSMGYSKYPDAAELKIFWSRIADEVKKQEVKKQIERQMQENLEADLDPKFDHASLNLKFLGIDIPFQVGAYATHVLKTIFDSNGYVVLDYDQKSTEIHASEDIYEDFLGYDIPKSYDDDTNKTAEQEKADDKLRNASRHLNKRVGGATVGLIEKKKEGVKKLFIGKTGRIQANPDYFKKLKIHKA